MELLQVIENKNMENESFFSRNVIIAFIIGGAIGFLGTWLPMREPAVDIASDDETEISDETSGVVLSGANAISVPNQKPGVNVNIEFVTLENTGWVVIHEDDNGTLGNALGAQLFDAGPSSGTVELLRGMEEGKTYYATIRQDDGDRAFDLTKDLLLSDETGNPVQAKFKASVIEAVE
mgnify:CR=1 FL=1